MKFIDTKSIFLPFALLVILGMGISACETEDDFVTLKTLEDYSSELRKIVDMEIPIVENCVVGYNKGDFGSETNYEEYTTNYLTVLYAADSILDLPDLTIADVMKANEDLTRPGDYFNSNVWISDRRPLSDLIIECDTLRVNTPVGTVSGSAPQAAHDQFRTAIIQANAVRKRATTIDRQVTEAVEALNPELDAFKAAIIK